MFLIGLAEDDLKIAQLVKTGLEEQGYRVISVTNGEQALTVFKSQPVDLIILDVMLPGLTGIEVSKLLRAHSADLPILMLTALGSIDDKIAGYHHGADDYLVKPFHFKELLLRIEALLRRRKQTLTEEFRLGYEDLTLDTRSKEVYRAGRLINLTAKEFSLLELFLLHPNRLLSRQFIAAHAWDVNFDTGTNVVDVYVNFLRNKIEKGFSKKLIHTKINMGYILK
jgi:two-component system copper resistance phosphate regulon response regulator CusR